MRLFGILFLMYKQLDCVAKWSLRSDWESRTHWPLMKSLTYPHKADRGQSAWIVIFNILISSSLLLYKQYVRDNISRHIIFLTPSIRSKCWRVNKLHFYKEPVFFFFCCFPHPHLDQPFYWELGVLWRNVKPHFFLLNPLEIFYNMLMS